jgi:hypothetical protein
MAEQPINYSAVRADLIARRDALDKRRKELDAAIAAVEAIQISTLAETMLAQTPPATVYPAEDKVFAKMTIVEGAFRFLTSKGSPQTARQITEALQHGGYEFGTTSNPSNTVNAVLHRASVKEKLKKNGTLYGLPHWNF